MLLVDKNSRFIQNWVFKFHTECKLNDIKQNDYENKLMLFLAHGSKNNIICGTINLWLDYNLNNDNY